MAAADNERGVRITGDAEFEIALFEQAPVAHKRMVARERIVISAPAGDTVVVQQIPIEEQG